MGKGNFCKIVMFVICSVILFGCSVDNITEENQEYDFTKRMSVETTNVLIEYVSGTRDAVKDSIRNNYFNSGLLVRWNSCDIKDVEVWEVNTLIFFKGKPKAIIDADNEEVDKATVYATCEDYKGN
ncbi:hypothetical protein [Aquimarina litoralis]|uniref:hypothetical protein n=1 Tax=Aquimarina litoralis TaxID=584605 RepID=UPI001C59C269|nr:hypothetical protein [Aquimarina litoralis]MBW1298738.1 hypothetical protein [Aquimarina litoralis]